MTFLTRAAVLAAVAAVPFAALSQAQTQQAQDYPTRTVRIVVPFGVGGPADIYARQIAQYLGETFKQPFVIENRPGAGSIIGTNEVAKSAADGYTLLLMSNTHTVNETMTPDKPFELMRDFVPVAPINYSDLLLVIHPSVKAQNLKEFIALAKSEPGKLNYGSSGPATPYHMAGELFKYMSGTDIVHVPHKASGGMRNAVIGGHVHMAFDAITTMAPNAQAGQVRALGTTAANRSSVMPDLPTVSEAGVPGYEATIWLGLMAPAGTPQAVVDRLNAEITKIVSDPKVRGAWEKQGAVPMTMSVKEFDAHLRKDIEKWGSVVKAAGLVKKK